LAPNHPSHSPQPHRSLEFALKSLIQSDDNAYKSLGFHSTGVRFQNENIPEFEKQAGHRQLPQGVDGWAGENLSQR
jgi:hypothetical protein